MSTYRMTITATPKHAGFVRAILTLSGADVTTDGYTITAEHMPEGIMQDILEIVPALLERGDVVSPPAIERLPDPQERAQNYA